MSGVLGTGRQERAVVEEIIKGFPLKPEILVERSYNKFRSQPLLHYTLLLERLDGLKFTVSFEVDELTFAQAYDPEGMLIIAARAQIEKAFKEIKKEDFFKAIEEWHLGDTEAGAPLKQYMRMTDEEYAYWEETGDMPESWEQ